MLLVLSTRSVSQLATISSPAESCVEPGCESEYQEPLSIGSLAVYIAAPLPSPLPVPSCATATETGKRLSEVSAAFPYLWRYLQRQPTPYELYPSRASASATGLIGDIASLQREQQYESGGSLSQEHAAETDAKITRGAKMQRDQASSSSSSSAEQPAQSVRHTSAAQSDFLDSMDDDWFDGTVSKQPPTTSAPASTSIVAAVSNALHRTLDRVSSSSGTGGAVDVGSATSPPPNITKSLTRSASTASSTTTPSPTRRGASPVRPTNDPSVPLPSAPAIIHNSKKGGANTQISSQQTSPSRKDVPEELVTETADQHTANEISQLTKLMAKMDRFRAVLDQPNVDLEKLRKLSWNGIPTELRPTAWKLLMGYLPCNDERRDQTLSKKRQDYVEYVRQSYGKGQEGLDHTIWHQIHIDIPRTNPSVKLYQHPRIRDSLERILYCWAIRHPASGYVQGINDLATPFFHVFLSPFVAGDDVENCDVDLISADALAVVEADTFWCLSKLLDGIQDNYTHAQPGIHRQIQKMKELIGRIDAQLYAHIQAQGIDFIQFAFRWINCLLMRELSLRNVIRMWDTYVSEGPDGFSGFHSYVCAAFLAKWSSHLQTLDFQSCVMFLQALPTKGWTEKEVELLLSEAFMWKSLFHNSPSHLASTAASSSNNAWSI